ncbi:hypothetical protein [Streptomyces sp. NPDC048419]|uniref:hypothetical protein n=1 Tax=Streptomyces sp. NPDC048419 TaxID=3365547 RepID=UPI003718B1A8
MRRTLNRARKVTWTIAWVYYPFAILIPWATSVLPFLVRESNPRSPDLHADNVLSGEFLRLLLPILAGYILMSTITLCSINPKTLRIPIMTRIKGARSRILSTMTIADSFVIWAASDTSHAARLGVLPGIGWFLLGALVAGTHIIATITFISLLKFLVYSRIEDFEHPYDALLVAMATACAEAHTHRSHWFKPTSTREVLASLERAASAAEMLAGKFSRLTSITDMEARKTAKEEAFGIAELIRKHKYAISRASGPGSYDRVIASLWAGITALVNDDWAAMLTEVNQSPRISKLHAAWQRLLPPVVLLGAAFTLPLIPDVANIPAVASSLRVTLLITAALTLVLPRESSARAPILDALGKALPIRPDK